MFPCVASAAWNIDTVDSGGDFRFTSLALDKLGDPHISYVNYNHGLIYATKNTTGWQIEAVDSNSYTGYFSSLDLDKNNYPHIVYLNSQESNLEYAWKTDSGWQYDNPPTNGHAQWAAAPLKLGHDGYPRIIMATYNGELQYFWKNDTGWYSEIIPNIRSASYPDLVLDENDQPHVSFASNGGGCSIGVLKYTVREPMGWYTEVVGDMENAWGSETSIRLDKNGYPRISYCDRSYQDLEYAWRDISRWHIENVDSEGDVGDQSSLYLDGAGFPHISYYDTSDTSLKYSWKNEAGWHIETVEDGGIGMGWHSSLVLDSSDRPYISYGDYSNSSLKFAWYEDALVAPVTDFTGSPRSGTAPLTVQFNDTSIGTGITAYTWFFSDSPATVFTDRNLTHTFATSGTYHVNHSATNGAGTVWNNVTGYITVNRGSTPTVTSITPDSGTIGTAVSITNLAGNNFRSRATVKLQKRGQSDITASSVVVVSPTNITCSFAIPATVATGNWDVVVTNSDGTSGTRNNGFRISTPPAPKVSSITPDSGTAGTAVSITNLAGNNFRSGATVRLHKNGQSDITASSVVVISPTKITGTFIIPATAATGNWDVVVMNSDGTFDTKNNGFRISKRN